MQSRSMLAWSAVVALVVLGAAAFPWPDHSHQVDSRHQRFPSDYMRVALHLQPFGGVRAFAGPSTNIESLGEATHPGLTLAFATPLQRRNPEEEFGSQDPSVTLNSEDELQSNNGNVNSADRRKREAENSTSSVHKGEEDYDDSDMFMEPDVEEKDPKTPLLKKEVEVSKAKDTTGMSQHFFPSFAPLFPPAPPLGHSRPQLLFQEPAHSHRPPLLRPQHNSFQPIGFGGSPFREHKYLHAPIVATESSSSNNLLGSGNFGVIRGGTFYNDNEQGEINEYGSGENHQVFSPYYHSNNGHGRPIFYGAGGASNPRPQQHHSNDFFANFRDFADINAPTKSSYSEYYIVYVNKNASHQESAEPKIFIQGETKPKNIIEQLTMIDQEDNIKEIPKITSFPTTVSEDTPTKKTSSAGKLKLARLYLEKTNKQKTKKTTTTVPTVPKDLYEPLLALS